MFGEASAVMTAEGLRGLWRGVLPSLYRTVPGVGLYFSSMHWMRYSVFQGKPNAGQSLLIGAAARTFAGSVMIPFTVVKTRIESGAFQYRSVFTALESILRNEGLRGLGLGAHPGKGRTLLKPLSRLLRPPEGEGGCSDPVGRIISGSCSHDSRSWCRPPCQSGHTASRRGEDTDAAW